MVVSWSPRGESKLNPVAIPRCPSPFEHNAAGDAMTEGSMDRTTAAQGRLDAVCTSPRFPQHYHRVKDFMSLVSPMYAEIPFADGSFASQSRASSQSQRDGRSADSAATHGALSSDRDVVKSVARENRRRSRSVDEMPVYAVPNKQSKEKHWPENRAVSEEDLSTSTPPLPPKLFDPHVEGMGVPFSAPSTREGRSSKAESSLPQSRKTDLDAVATEGEAAKKPSRKMFRGGLPWFGKKLTSRRRSRSCEVLSPLPNSADAASGDRASKQDSCDQFPLVKLDRSPTFCRRVLTQPRKLPDKQPGSSSSSQEAKFELMEYASSPMRMGLASTFAEHHTPAGGLRRGKSLRRRSRSLEQISSPFLETPHRSHDAGVSSHQEALSAQRQFQPPRARAGAMPLPRPAEKPTADGPSSTGSSASTTPLPLGHRPEVQNSAAHVPELHPKAHCNVYEQVKSDVKKELSSLVSKIQLLSAPETAPESKSQDTSMEVEELESSPKRLGQTQDSVHASTSEPAKGTGTPREDLSHDGPARCAPGSPVIAFSASLLSARAALKTQAAASTSSICQVQSHTTADGPTPPAEGAGRDQAAEEVTQTLGAPTHLGTIKLPAVSQVAAFSLPSPTAREAWRSRYDEVQGRDETGMHSGISENFGILSYKDAVALPETSRDAAFPVPLPTVKEAPRSRQGSGQGLAEAGMHPTASENAMDTVTLPAMPQDAAFPEPLPTVKEAPRSRQGGDQGLAEPGVHPTASENAMDTVTLPAMPAFPVPLPTPKEAPRSRQGGDQGLAESGMHPTASENAMDTVTLPAMPTFPVPSPSLKEAPRSKQGKGQDHAEPGVHPTASENAMDTVTLPAMPAFPVPLPTPKEAPRSRQGGDQGLAESGMHPTASENAMDTVTLPAMPAFPVPSPTLKEAPRSKQGKGQDHAESGVHSTASENAMDTVTLPAMPAFPVPLPTPKEAPRNRQGGDQGLAEAGMHPATSENAAFTVSQPAALRDPANNPREAPSHVEAVRSLSVSKEVAFSVHVPAAKPLTGVCKPLSAALTSETPTWLTPYKARRPQRRRSRSVGEASAFSTFREAHAHPQAQPGEASSGPAVTPAAATALTSVSFTPSVPGLADCNSWGLSSPRPPPVKGLKPPPCSQPPASTPGTFAQDGAETSTKGLSQQIPPAVRNPPPQPITPKQPPQATAEQQPSQQRTAPVKAPPPVTEKQQQQQQQLRQQTAPRVSAGPQQQIAEEEATAVPSVKTILQRFGGALRSAPQRNRRRSRSVGDVSVLQDAESGGSGSSGSSQTGEGGGFASVRAFWDRLRGKAGGDERPGVTLQRKPSTMRLLQQQLYGVEAAPGSSVSDAAPERLKSSPAGRSSPQAPAADEGHRDPPRSRNTSDGKASPAPSPQAAGAAAEQLNTPAGKVHEESSSEKASGKMPIQRSPFVTVRRQSSRKRNTGSPFCSTAEQSSAGSGTPNSKDPTGKEVASDPALRNTSTATGDTSTATTPPAAEQAAANVMNNGHASSAQTSHVGLTTASTHQETLAPGKERCVADDKPEEVAGTRGPKKRPVPPPKPPPKPTLHALIATQQRLGPERPPPPGDLTGQTSLEIRTRKRRSQETDQADAVPEKLSAAGAGATRESRGPVTRSTSRSQMKIPEDSRTTPQFNYTVDAGRQEKVQSSPDTGAQTASSAAKRRSTDKADHAGLSREGSHSSSGLSAVPRRVSSGKKAGHAFPAVGRQGGLKEADSSSRAVSRKSSGRERKADSPVVKRQSSSKRPHPDSPAVKRQSFGKEQRPRNGTPRRRSSTKVAVARSDSGRSRQGSIVGKDQLNLSTQVHRSDSGRSRQGSIVGKDQLNLSTQVHRSDCGRSRRGSIVGKDQLNLSTQVHRSDSGRSRQGSVVGKDQGKLSAQVHRSGSGRGTVIQSQPSERGKAASASSRETRSGRTEKSAVCASPGVQHDISDSAGRDPKGASPVRRYNSAREEAKGPSAASSAKRFNSLRDDTRSSRAKRRSRDGSQGTPGPKRTSTGSGRSSRRESGKVKRTESGRQARGGGEGAAADTQAADTPSRAGSFRRHGVKPPQSPTFLRITRRLGVLDDDDCSSDDDSGGEEVGGGPVQFTQRAVLVLNKARPRSPAGQAPELALSDRDRGPPAGAAGLVQDHGSSSGGHSERQRSALDVQIETDIDACATEEMEPNLGRERQKNTAKLSTMVWVIWFDRGLNLSKRCWSL